MAKRDPKPAPNESDIDAFSKLVRRVQIENVQLLCSSVKGEREFILSRAEPDASIEVETEVGCGGKLDPKAKKLFCEVAFAVKFFKDGDEAPSVEITETYVATYGIEGDEAVGESTIQFFAENNALFNVWSFFRSAAHSTTMRLGLPGYVLPLLKPMVKRKG